MLSNILAQIYAFIAKAQGYYDMLITKTAGNRERYEKASQREWTDFQASRYTKTYTI